MNNLVEQCIYKHFQYVPPHLTILSHYPLKI